MNNIDEIERPLFVNNIIMDISKSPTVVSIWLVGSRANGNETAKSDWDILVFSTD